MWLFYVAVPMSGAFTIPAANWIKVPDSAGGGSASEATRNDIGLVKATSPDGSGTTTLGTAAANYNRAVSFNMMGSSTTLYMSNYRTPGEWYFYRSPISGMANAYENDPPFLIGSTGLYLKVMMGYSTTICIQTCWRRGSPDMFMRYSTSATAWSDWRRFAYADEITGGGGLRWVGTQAQYNSASSIPTDSLIIIHEA
jgi:hypothetical protein